ncbi:MAG: hypothetical protein WC791_00105 [Candidatus Paceibacterota bacterium]
MLKESAFRRQQAEMTEHHRKPRSREGKSIPQNISKVPIKKHRAWHVLFRNHTPDVIAKIINKIWLDPDFEFVVVRKPKFQK